MLGPSVVEVDETRTRAGRLQRGGNVRLERSWPSSPEPRDEAGSIYGEPKAPLPRSPFLATAMQMIVGGLVLALVAAIAGEGGQLHLSAFSMKSMLALAYLIVFGALIAFTAYIWLLGVSTPARVSTYAYVNPAVAVLLGWGLANERLDVRAGLAVLIILSAVRAGLGKGWGYEVNREGRTGRPHYSIRRGAGLGKGWGYEAYQCPEAEG